MKALTRLVGEMALSLAGILLISFLFMQWLPGDPASLYAGEDASQSDVDAIRHRLGLDAPLHIQLGRYLGRLAGGNMGTSLRSGKPVAKEIGARLGITGSLAALASFIAITVALPLGCIAAVRPQGWLPKVLEWGGLILLAIPVYWLGLLLILGLALMWRLFPPGGSETGLHLVLPATALGVHTGIATGRVLRISLLEVLGKAYVTTARGKGASQKRAIWIHALPNALIPVVTFFAMEAGRLLGGAVLTETVFSINGLGRYLIQSIAFRDYPSVMGVVLIMAVTVTFANFLADIVCILLNPKARE